MIIELTSVIFLTTVCLSMTVFYSSTVLSKKNLQDEFNDRTKDLRETLIDDIGDEMESIGEIFSSWGSAISDKYRDISC